MTDHSVSCPAARATKGRRKGLNRVWSTKEHKATVKAFCEGKTCQWCGSRDKLTAHHPYIESYKGCYTDLELSGCFVLCNRCHFSLHKGLILCPVCKKHYHRVGAEMCKECFLKKHPEIVARRIAFYNELAASRKAIKDARNAKNRAAKRKHPCKSRTISGRCQRSAIGSRCTYAPTKAEAGCMDFIRKKGVKA